MLLHPIKSITILVISTLLVTSCKTDKNENNIIDTAENIENPKNTKPLRPAEIRLDEFKAFWYDGKAEVTSYTLTQSRYGELRQGTAVMIFVTEEFLPEVQVKADNASKDNIKVLKLNATKQFNTGIYPYSIMQSTFFPVLNNQHALKVTTSVQEWCGHVFTQINNREQFEINAFSYFQSEADQNFKLEKSYLENELWTQLRINPKSLPVGNLDMIPSLEYLRLKHKDIKAYKAIATLEDSIYKVNYPELNRTLSIFFNAEFPFNIHKWEETYPDNRQGELMTTTAVQLKTIKESYWQKNKNEDFYLRGQLGLD